MTNNWKDIHPHFTFELQVKWESQGFTSNQVKEWIDIGLTPQDAGFAKWLEQEGYTALAVLDYEDSEKLREEYQNSLNNPRPCPSSLPNPQNWPWKSILILILLALFAYYLLK